MTEENSKLKNTDEAPPIFKSWNRFYAAVLINLAILIILFYTFTRIFE